MSNDKTETTTREEPAKEAPRGLKIRTRIKAGSSQSSPNIGLNVVAPGPISPRPVLGTGG